MDFQGALHKDSSIPATPSHQGLSRTIRAVPDHFGRFTLIRASPNSRQGSAPEYHMGGTDFYSARSARSKKRYSVGSTTSVRSVLETRPPITTVAGDFCTSAPGPVASAIGTNPREGTRVVMSTGRSRVSEP